MTTATERTAESIHDACYTAIASLTECARPPHDWLGYHWTVVDLDGSTLAEGCDTAWAVAHIAIRDDRRDYFRIAQRLLSATIAACKNGRKYYGDCGAVCLTPAERR